MIVVYLAVVKTRRGTVDKLGHNNRAKSFKGFVTLVPILLFIVELLVPIIVDTIVGMFQGLLKLVDFVKNLKIGVKTILLVYLLLIYHVITFLIYNV